LNKPIENIGIADVSALGAAYLAGLQQGVYENIEYLSGLNRNKKINRPLETSRIDKYYEGWKKAIRSSA
jgi:glycerol kinase